MGSNQSHMGKGKSVGHTRANGNHAVGEPRLPRPHGTPRDYGDGDGGGHGDLGDCGNHTRVCYRTPHGGSACRCFERASVWIFDLDNTLYPASSNLFDQIAERMNLFIERLLGLSREAAQELRRRYYLEFGTTLAGLMARHGVAPDAFLSFVHDIDHSPIAADPPLARALAALPGRRYIFTNGTRRHAECVAARLGVLDHFDGIFDIADAAYVPKPHRATFERFCERLEVAPPEAVMFEDLPHNLETAHALGMTTVLVHSSYDDHPSQREIAAGAPPPAHVHHMTDDLAHFVGQLAARRAR